MARSASRAPALSEMARRTSRGGRLTFCPQPVPAPSSFLIEPPWSSAIRATIASSPGPTRTTGSGYTQKRVTVHDQPPADASAQHCPTGRPCPSVARSLRRPRPPDRDRAGRGCPHADPEPGLQARMSPPGPNSPLRCAVGLPLAFTWRTGPRPLIAKLASAARPRLAERGYSPGSMVLPSRSPLMCSVRRRPWRVGVPTDSPRSLYGLGRPRRTKPGHLLESR